MSLGGRERGLGNELVGTARKKGVNRGVKWGDEGEALMRRDLADKAVVILQMG